MKKTTENKKRKPEGPKAVKKVQCKFDESIANLVEDVVNKLYELVNEGDTPYDMTADSLKYVKFEANDNGYMDLRVQYNSKDSHTKKECSYSTYDYRD